MSKSEAQSKSDVNIYVDEEDNGVITKRSQERLEIAARTLDKIQLHYKYGPPGGPYRKEETVVEQDALKLYLERKGINHRTFAPDSGLSEPFDNKELKKLKKSLNAKEGPLAGRADLDDIREIVNSATSKLILREGKRRGAEEARHAAETKRIEE